MIKFFRRVGLFSFILLLGMLFVDIDAIMPDGQYLQQRIMEQRFMPDLQEIMFKDRMLNFSSVQQELSRRGFEKSIQEIKEGMAFLSVKYPDKIISRAGGFITVAGMLDQPLYKLAFVGSHNSYNNMSDSPKASQKIARHQSISMKDSLEFGVRMIELNVGKASFFAEPSHYNLLSIGGSTPLNKSIDAIKVFLNQHPNDIIFVKLSYFYQGAKLANEDEKNKLMEYYLERLSKADLLQHVFNYSPGKKVRRTGVNKGYNTATLLELIGQDKRVILMIKDVNDEEMDYLSVEEGDPYSYSPHAMANWLNTGIMTNRENLLSIEYFPTKDLKVEPSVAQINNDGYRLFERMDAIHQKTQNRRRVNFVSLDFIQGNQKQGGTLNATAVDAVNRLNLNAYGGGWLRYSNHEFYWGHGPLGQRGEIMSKIKKTQVIHNGLTLSEGDMVTDGLFFYGLPLNDLNQLEISHEFTSPVKVKYYGVNLTYEEKMTLTYTASGRIKGQWELLKEGQLDYRLGPSWYVIDLGNHGQNLDAIEVTFTSDEAGIKPKLTEISIYNEDAPAALKQINNVYSYIVENDSLKVLSSDGWSDKEDVKVVLDEGMPTKLGQRWRLKYEKNGFYSIENGYGLVLTADDKDLIQKKNNFADNQLWSVEPLNTTKDGFYENLRIRNKKTNELLRVKEKDGKPKRDEEEENDEKDREVTWHMVYVPSYISP